MTFTTAADRSRAISPNSNLMKTPKHLEAMIHGANISKAKRPLMKPVSLQKAIKLAVREDDDSEAVRSYINLVQKERRYSQKLTEVRHRMAEACRRPMPGDFEIVAKLVGEITGFHIREIMGKGGSRPLCQARHAFIRVAKSIWPGLSTVEIGKKFGADHSSIVYALGRHRRHAVNKATEAKINRIIDQTIEQLNTKLELSGQRI